LKSTRSALFFLLVVLLPLAFASAQLQRDAALTATAGTVPTLVKFNGVAQDATGKPLNGRIGITFALYSEQQGGAPLWLETQNVSADVGGHYSAMLGASRPEGLPPELFTTGEARWLGLSVNGEREQPRVLLLSVPYALKAKDAETVGGLPPSAFMLAAPPASSAPASADTTANTVTRALATVTGTGTLDFLPIWTGTSTMGNSALFQTGSGAMAKVGVNTTTPASTLDVKGGETVRGLLNLPPTGTATAAQGFNSNPEELTASTFNSATKAATNQNFAWRAEAAANNTASPSGTLNLLYAPGAATLAETGLKIAANGQITFAKGQSFPGTGPGTVKSVALSAPASDFTVTGSPVANSGTLGLNWKVAPTDASTSNAIVKRDAFGNFSANSVSVSTGIFNDVFNTGQAILASSSQPGATTITGLASAATGVGFGVLGETSSTDQNALGVYGFADANTGSGTGVKGFAAGDSGVGVYGVLVGPSITGADSTAAVWGDSSVQNATAVLASADDGTAVIAENNSSGNPSMVVVNNSNNGGGIFLAEGTFPHQCSINVNADLSCTGTVTGAIAVSPSSRVALSAIESPENWFEDFGSAQLTKGSAIVQLESLFAQTVNTDIDYHVFLTPNGDCKGLYVSQKSPTSFEVHELGGGSSSIFFDYRIVAKRKGYENIRLADVTKQFTPRQLTRRTGGKRSSGPDEFHRAPLEKVPEPRRPGNPLAVKK
jgi:hypothetical protein